MFRKFYTTILLLLITFSFAVAQSGTGRVSGKVIDKQTGEALIGANVIIEGTTLGAATDANGEYLISQVPSGTYTVRASYIGFQSSKVTNVRITSGLTTNINFSLASTEFSTEELVIVAKKPLIEKSSTNAKRIVSAEDLESLPTRSLTAIVALQPGVVMLNGDTFIRGSRADETGYTVEGADVKDILDRDGGSLVTVTPDAVQELVVQAGGYTAQYGNANAGIVSQDFKTGTEQYHASFRAETDNFGNYPYEQFLDTYSYGYSDFVATVSGPLFTKKLKFFISGERYNMDDRTPTFFYDNPTAYSDGALWDTTKVYDGGRYGGSKKDYYILNWNPGNLDNRGTQRYTTNSTLLFDSNPFLIRLSAAFTRRETDRGGRDIRHMFNTRPAGKYEGSNLLLNLKTTYLVSANSYFTAKVNFFDGRDKWYDPLFGDNVLEYYDSLANAKHGYKFRSYTTGPATFDAYGFPFFRDGTPRSWFTKEHNNYIGGSVDYTAQIDKHSIKTGASYQRWTVRHYSPGSPSNFLNTIRKNPDKTFNTDSLQALMGQFLYRGLDNYGYDLFGAELDDGIFGAKHPVLASAYIEDRFEISDIILNLGLRYDFIDMNSWRWADPKFPKFDDKTNLPLEGELLDGHTYGYVSPRLGFSFPVSDRTVFHLQYGKFVQSPGLDVAYRGIYQAKEIMEGANFINNPIAYDPKPIRTTSYEIGFGHQLSDFAAVDITAFYKDIKNQLQYKNIQTAAGARKPKYGAFVNQDFSTSQGVEISFKMRRVERVAAQINYTYSDAEGTNSFVGSGVGAAEYSNDAPTVILPLDYNYTHSGNISVDYRFGKDDGGPIFENFGANLLLRFNSGHPYTLAQPIEGLGQNLAWQAGIFDPGDTRQRKPQGPINSATTPWQFTLNLRVDKTVDIAGLDFNFYVYVSNLLNTKNVLNVYDRTGNAYDDGFLSSAVGKKVIESATERFADLYRALNLNNRQHAFYQYDYDLFSAPRQIRVGLKVNF